MSNAAPAHPDAVPPTSPEIAAKVDRVFSHKHEWVGVPLSRRVAYLKRCLEGVVANAEAWVQAGCRLKGIPPTDVMAGEEWVAGPYATARNLRLLVRALEHGGHPKPSKVRMRADGQRVASVFPTSVQDRVLFNGFEAEVWIEPGRDASQGRIYRDEPTPRTGKVALVLGGGNVSSIPPMDVLYKLFVEDDVVVLKMNPVNETIGPHLENAFAALIEDGFLAIVYGGASVGAALANDPKIDTLHVTGSDRTYDAIVWGATRDEQTRRKAEDAPLNRRPFTAELGCVTPILVVPGPWSRSDMDFQARHVAAMVTNNASFNCNAAKVLVTARGWLQRKEFLAKVEAALAAARPRKAYYPGAEQRYQGFLERYPHARQVGAKGDGVVPWTLIPGVAAEKGEYALTHEAFCGIVAEVALDMDDDPSAPRFLDDAVAFANEKCWGSLSCGLLVHPFTARDHAAELDAAIARLRYGGIGVNCWPALVYALGTTTWGAFPGHTSKDIQSGVGVVHNAFLFDHPQKSVVRAPFRIWPTPVWFSDNENVAEIGKRLVRMEANPTWRNVIGVAFAALRG